uniref:TGF-beta family profile domain-containing protein n=1 Tax=Laticauda laticaudata TaxID=8630 RepID=A0A8C5S885_LATLA
MPKVGLELTVFWFLDQQLNHQSNYLSFSVSFRSLLKILLYYIINTIILYYYIIYYIVFFVKNTIILLLCKYIIEQLKITCSVCFPLCTVVHTNESTSGNLQAATHVHLEFSRTAALYRSLNILRAKLSLFKEWLDTPSNTMSNVTWPVRVNLYRLSKREKVTSELLTSQEISRTSPSLSLTGVVEQWVGSWEPKLNLGLEFRSDKAAWLAASITEEGTGMPSLMIEAETRKAVRKARQLDEEECRKGDGKCCLRSLKVSFEAIGWSDWVVAPQSYSMKFCEGSCPHNYKPASMHAQIKARLHSLSGETPAPCCVPAAYEPMVLMHYGNDGKVATQLFDDMIVTRCHCA